MTDEGFAISIVAGPDVHSSSVSVHGRVQHVISDDERKTFGLKGDDLDKAVDKYFGKKPNDAFLHGPRTIIYPFAYTVELTLYPCHDYNYNGT